MGGFFKRLDVVVIDDQSKRWCVDSVRDAFDRDGDVFQMAHLSDEDGNRTQVRTDRLTKVAG